MENGAYAQKEKINSDRKGGMFDMMTDRVRKIREKYFDTIPQITAERLVLATEAHKKFAGDAIPVFRAKIVRYVMEHMTTLIMEDELVVGTPTNKYKGANLFPEYTSSKWLTEDIDDFPVRKTDPYYISPEDREVILETLKEWEGRAMEDIAGEVLPDYIENARQKDLISVGCRNGVSGETTPNHQKFMDIGLKGFMEECRANIAEVRGGTKEKQEKESVRQQNAAMTREKQNCWLSRKTAESYRKIHRRLSIRRYRWYGSSRWHSISRHRLQPAGSADSTSTCIPSTRRIWKLEEILRKKCWKCWNVSI